MKRWIVPLILLLLFRSAQGQQPRPANFGSVHLWDLYIQTGDFDFSNKDFSGRTDYFGDGDTLKIDLGTAFYALDLEIGDARVWGVDSTGKMIGPNGEKWDNTADRIIRWLYDDDDDSLGIVYYESSVDSPNVADNDLWIEAFRASDDSSEVTEWVKRVPKILDASDESEGSEYSIFTYLAGSQITSMKMAGHTWTMSQGETLDNVTDGTIQATAGVIKHAYDADAYWTATQADGGLTTFNSVSDGTSGFAFQDDMEIQAGLTVNTVNFLSDTSSADDSYGGDIAPAPDAYVTGMPVILTVGTANTGACTVEFNGLDAKSVKTTDGSDPADNDLVTTGAYFLVYDGTNFILMNPSTTAN